MSRNAILIIGIFTFFSRIVIPWYLKGLLNSINSARSGLIVSGATIISARSFTISPMRPVHSFFPPTVINKYIYFQLELSEKWS